MAQWVKNSPSVQETQGTWVQSLGQEDPLEEGMATHSSILAWRIPWLKSLVDYSPWGHKEWDMTKRFLFTHTHFYREVIPGESGSTNYISFFSSFWG